MYHFSHCCDQNNFEKEDLILTPGLRLYGESRGSWHGTVRSHYVYSQVTERHKESGQCSAHSLSTFLLSFHDASEVEQGLE